ncbi:Aromatic prenyltransferase Orf2 [Actinopolyspora mzabensis]|uniref:Aromatic prenyltransferase Orf2 n=1 Tax=Actinopolyspora mzabensis TaxID=995066 RepID=A0A1G8VJ27_ACTMZ|nr:aromatic prenyltransferase [Actinopolyspora mzabensis]SDJ66058.1 Aromatic prenyltransferase Orf2 [Actinopolyspora mzabensis]
MSGDADSKKDVYSAIEKSAGLMNAPCSRHKVGPVLDAFGDDLGEAGIVFSVQTGEQHAGELDYTITVPATGDDPYTLALSNGLLAETEHPVGALLSDIRARCRISEYFIDCGVAGGFNKAYAHFPHDPQSVTRLAELPSMPSALADNSDFFARHGLEQVAMAGIDYGKESVNLYFAQLSEGSLERSNILSMLRASGLPEPAGQLLNFARGAFRIYVTLTWDSSAVKRIAFASRMGQEEMEAALSEFPVRVSPEIERFVRNAPHTYSGDRLRILAVKSAPEGEYLNFGSYYQISPLVRNLLAASDDERS